MLNKKKYFMSLVFFLFICLVCSFGGIQQGRAADEEGKSEEDIMNEIESHRNSIVHIESICWDGEEYRYRIKSLTGFVVSKDTSSIYIVTAYNNLIYTSEEIEKIKTEYELEENVRISEKIEVVFNGDLRVQASIVGESGQRNLAILKLNQNVNFEDVLQFSKKNTVDNEQIFLLSYPAATGASKAIYNMDNVEITPGILFSPYQAEGIKFFKHDIQAVGDAVGGPLLDKNGNVSGLMLTPKGKTNGKAISGEEIKFFLDTFNVPYQEYEKAVAEKRFSVLNIILGIAIFVLILIIAGQKKRVKPIKDKGTDKYSSKTVKEESEKRIKKKSEKTSNAGRNINARLEYPSEKRVVIIHKAMFMIGRAKEADFILSESTGVSRKHACIRFDGNHFCLTDLKSTNHTFLNGLELIPGEKRILKDGDEIVVGKEKLIFHNM